MGCASKDMHLFKKCTDKGFICSKITLFWIRNLIIYVYDKDTSIKPRGYEVRTLANSWVLHKGANIHDIIFAASCVSTTTLYHTSWWILKDSLMGNTD